MNIIISKEIFGINGQRVNVIEQDKDGLQLVIYCQRDRHKRTADPVSREPSTDMFVVESETYLY